MKYNLPVNYDSLTALERRLVREQYVIEQNSLCMFCHYDLRGNPPIEVTEKSIDMKLFPKNFLRWPIHLQHDHNTGLTEGAVHAYCNAVMWQYYGK